MAAILSRPQCVKTIKSMFFHAKNFSYSTSRGYYSGVIMSAMASRITGVSIIYSTVCSGADQTKKHQSFASLAFVMGIHRWSVNSPPEGSVTRKMFSFEDVIMEYTHSFVVLVLLWLGSISSSSWYVWSIWSYISWLLHWHLDNHDIAPDHLPLRVVISMFMNIFLQTHSLM